MKIALGGTPIATLQERWYAEIRRGRAFMGMGAQTGVAAQSSHVQLFNPAASGVNAIVFVVAAGTTTAQGLQLLHYDTALTNLDGRERNLLSGGAAPQCQTRIQGNAAILGAQFGHLYLPVSQDLVLPFQWLTELAPGKGLNVVGEVVNTLVVVTFGWLELPQ